MGKIKKITPFILGILIIWGCSKNDDPQVTGILTVSILDATSSAPLSEARIIIFNADSNEPVGGLQYQFNINNSTDNASFQAEFDSVTGVVVEEAGSPVAVRRGRVDVFLGQLPVIGPLVCQFPGTQQLGDLPQLLQLQPGGFGRLNRMTGVNERRHEPRTVAPGFLPVSPGEHHRDWHGARSGSQRLDNVEIPLE